MPESNRSKYTFDSYSGDTNLVIDIWSVSDDLGHHDGLVKRCIDDLTPSVKTNDYDFEEDDTNIAQLVNDTTQSRIATHINNDILQNILKNGGILNGEYEK